jgi:hypothetical protein
MASLKDNHLPSPKYIFGGCDLSHNRKVLILADVELRCVFSPVFMKIFIESNK